MKLVKTPSEAPRTALSYITIGAILTIWAAVWMWQFPTSHSRFLSVLCTGILLTGIALLVIGFSVGLIGRVVRHDEPPVETRGTTAGGPVVASNANASPQPAVKPVVGVVGAPPSGNNGGA